ncbi:hypothetical protein [Bradyrhizobium sp. CCGUVB23]|uniref:hypothetical protein n=1 Tax=Bradyrhizobium sp. CCGUVB23 TaxID=2949630 RepID=UPI0020B17D45|nr:hypothetical protein [Bradyrhizobium sp. CCGUVB23]MCP3459593.1 hypothetical protein [Bradyrhizobium sp. CCGUVB23]
MSKGPTGVEYPIFHIAVPTKDGRWMVSAIVDGKVERLSGFLGSQEDAEAIAQALNDRELARYEAESGAKIEASFRRSLKEVAQELGISWTDE